jgi:D-3-phosphoglycerate dehydrogenase
MKKKVLVTLSFSPSLIANFDSCVSDLESKGYEVVVDHRHRSLDREELIGVIGGVHAHVASAECIDEEVLAHADSLKIVSRMGVGYDRVDVAALNRRGIALTITPGANAEPVAEYAVAMMMAVTRKLRQIETATRSGVWEVHFGSSVPGKTLGIIGLGNIGKEVVRYTSGFGMNVLAYDPYPDAAYGQAHGVTFGTLEEVLANSDYLFLHAPYTGDNRRFLSAKQFGMMKKGAYFINCARGELVDEAALYDALKSGHLAAAALDVFEQEPVDMSNPLFTLDNVLLSSHTAGMTFEGRKKVIDMAFQNIAELDGGIRPKGLVNPDVLDKNKKEA